MRMMTMRMKMIMMVRVDIYGDFQFNNFEQVIGGLLIYHLTSNTSSFNSCNV